MDLHLTIKHLSSLSYINSVDKYHSDYYWWKSGKYLGSSVSLLLEKIPNTRTCDDINIPSFYCACMKMKTIERDVYDSKLQTYEYRHSVTGDLDFLI